MFLADSPTGSIWCNYPTMFFFFSRVPQSGPAHGGSDAHPIPAGCGLPAPLGGVPTACGRGGCRRRWHRCLALLCPRRCVPRLRRRLAHPSQRQRRLPGGRRPAACSCVGCACRPQRCHAHWRRHELCRCLWEPGSCLPHGQGWEGGCSASSTNTNMNPPPTLLL